MIPASDRWGRQVLLREHLLLLRVHVGRTFGAHVLARGRAGTQNYREIRQPSQGKLKKNVIPFNCKTSARLLKADSDRLLDPQH